MATSKVKIYQTVLTPARNALVDDLEAYLNSLTSSNKSSAFIAREKVIQSLYQKPEAMVCRLLLPGWAAYLKWSKMARMDCARKNTTPSSNRRVKTFRQAAFFQNASTQAGMPRPPCARPSGMSQGKKLPVSALKNLSWVM